MSSGNPEWLRAAKSAVINAVAVFVVTTVHHVFGAYLYNTPWRIHAAIVSGVATALMAASLWLSRRHQGNAIGPIAWWSFIAVGVVIPFMAFGVFEGAYNHALKDALYFAHASPEFMRQLFPPPTYEMPNNAFFEVTGVMHIIPGCMTCYYLFRVVQQGHKQGRIAAKGRAARAA